MVNDDLPATYFASVLKDHHFEIQELPLPALGPSDVLVHLTASGVCGTDFALADGKLGPCRSILGHEGVGRVVKLGAALTTSQVELGQRVGVAWTRDVCNRCAMCMTELGETRCLEQIQSGRKVDGTFTQYTVVPYQYLMPLPELLTDEEIAPILCGGVTIYKALKICGATPGQWITIVGAGGGVGSLGIQYAKSMGFRVIAIDAGEDKRWYCMGLGAEAYMDATNTADIKYDMARITKGSAASASIAVAGSARAYQTSLDSLGPFGTLVCIGIPPPQDLVQIHPLQIIDMGIRIIGSAVGTRGDVLAALEFVKRRAVVPVVRKGSLQSLEEIATHFKEGKVLGKYVLDLTIVPG